MAVGDGGIELIVSNASELVLDAWLVGEGEIEVCLDTGGRTVPVSMVILGSSVARLGGLIGVVVGFAPGGRRVPVSVIIPRGSIGDVVGWDTLDGEPVVPVGGIVVDMKPEDEG